MVELSDGEAWESASLGAHPELDVGDMALPMAGGHQGEQGKAGECHHQEQVDPPAAHHLQEVQGLG